MMKKTILLPCAFLGLAFGLASCSDFFEPENSTVLAGKNYLSDDESEMYSGYFGLITKLQKVADRPIYLTDSRAELLLPTDRVVDMQNLSNYEDNLNGNGYADPARFYDVIISCNDYLERLYKYKQSHIYTINKDNYAGLVANTIRLKTWTYFMLAKIYGQVVWFDDPMLEMKDFSVYPKLDLAQTVDKCWAYLNTPFDEVDISSATMSWKRWIAENDDNLNADAYENWDKLVPDYFVLAADLCLWRGDYQKVVDLVLPKMNEAFGTSSNYTKWMCAANYHNAYARFFSNNATPEAMCNVSAVMYMSQRNQNSNVKSILYDGGRLLTASPKAVARYHDPEFDPGTTEQAWDGRWSAHLRGSDETGYQLQKYRSSEGPIYLYRNVDLYFMLIEAFNHLGRYEEMNVLMNQGVSKVFPQGGVTYPGFTDDWTLIGGTVTHTYADTGIRGTWFKAAPGEDGHRKMYVGGTPDADAPAGFPTSAEEGQRYNDMQLLDEICLEMPAEGKTLPAMIRMARRYGGEGLKKMADLVCGKYDMEDPAQAATAVKVRARILAGDYFVHWDLNSTAIH